jgi:DNA (cytosine-5)-methyltransferase 1
MSAIYNEIDPFAARWLDGLIAGGHIAQGSVDRRSIVDLKAVDVDGPGQRHFFAGIGGWSHALRLAGVPDYADVWTGSCPCQPFSDAGKRGGVRDARHLWPAWFDLIDECRPPVILGEQVASRAGLGWLDLVRADLERCDYAFGASDLCAAGVGAPHIRQRLYFVAYSDEVRQQRAGLARFGLAGPAHRCDCGHVADSHEWHSEGPRECGECSCTYFVFDRGVAHADGQPRRLPETQRQPGRADSETERGSEVGELADPDRYRRIEGTDDIRTRKSVHARSSVHGRAVANATGKRRHARRTDQEGDEGDGSPVMPERHGTSDPWNCAEWIPCSDGVSRPVEPGTHPLAHGVSGRVGLLRGYGNAIVPQVAAAFIRAALEAL